MGMTAQGYEQFDPEDAEVIQWLNGELTGELNSSAGNPLGTRCYHLKRRGFDFLGVQFHAGQQGLSKVSLNRLKIQLTKKFSSAARLYEQGRLHSLEKIELYLTHWLRWSKGIGIASLNALDAIRRTLTLQDTAKTSEIMIPTFIRAMVAWVEQQTNRYYEITTKEEIRVGASAQLRSSIEPCCLSSSHDYC